MKITRSQKNEKSQNDRNRKIKLPFHLKKISVLRSPPISRFINMKDRVQRKQRTSVHFSIYQKPFATLSDILCAVGRSLRLKDDGLCGGGYASGGSLLADDGEWGVGRYGGKRRASPRTNWLELARAGAPVFADGPRNGGEVGEPVKSKRDREEKEREKQIQRKRDTMHANKFRTSFTARSHVDLSCRIYSGRIVTR